jgi:hypothetical protein
MKAKNLLTGVALGSAALALGNGADAQMRDIKEKMTLPQANAADGIRKNLPETVGAGRGNLNTIGSSIYIINRDPARSIRRGRQLFQRKFLDTQGFSGRDRAGNIHLDPSIGAGVVDPPARLGRLRRRRVHPTRQSRRAASVRPRIARAARR